jgi:acetyl esterase/lipase
LDWADDDQTISILRKFVAIQERSDEKDPAVDEQVIEIPARDGFGLPSTVFRPANFSGGEARPGLPLFVLFYGGGFIMGSPVLMAGLARSVVKKFHAVVVAPTYRLAPEHPFPTGFNDGWDVISWLAEHAPTKLQSDLGEGFIVGGISAGGNVTNIVTHLARDRGLKPPITGQWLSIPGVRLGPDHLEQLPQKYQERLLGRNQKEAVDDPSFPPGMRDLIDRANKRDPTSELASPMIWPSVEGKDFGQYGHRDLPRTYSQVCGVDGGRDELLVFDDILKNEGVPTRLDLYPGLPHAFWRRFTQLPESKRWEEDTLNGFAWLLNR